MPLLSKQELSYSVYLCLSPIFSHGITIYYERWGGGRVLKSLGDNKVDFHLKRNQAQADEKAKF